MTRTVEEGFREFHTRLTPYSGETDAAKKHRASIEACLKSNFEITRFFRSGSFGHATSIAGYSDVDYIASIPRTNLKDNSSVTLREVKEVLIKRFTTSNPYVDCPAVVIPFGTNGKETTEVVPADYLNKKTSKGYCIYEIPNCSGKWMVASPEAHSNYVKKIDKKHSNKVRALIRFMKAWKYYNKVPISSFYLEMRVAKYASEEPLIIYAKDMKKIFNFLDYIELVKMTDPIGVSGYIASTYTEAKFEEAISKLSTAKVRAQKAFDCEKSGNTSDSFYWWNKVFNQKFPTYYY